MLNVFGSGWYFAVYEKSSFSSIDDVNYEWSKLCTHSHINLQSSKNEMKNIVHKQKKTSTCRTESYLNVKDSKTRRNSQSSNNEMENAVHCDLDKELYLGQYDSKTNGPIHAQKWAVKNMQDFHSSMKFKIRRYENSKIEHMHLL